MRTLRSFESMIKRLRLTGSGGGRIESLEFADFVQPVSILDNVSGVQVPMQRLVVGCTPSHPAVALRFSWVGVSAITRPVKLLYLRPSGALLLSILFDTAELQLLGAFTIYTPEYWESPRTGAFLPATPPSRCISLDTAATIFVGPTAGSVANAVALVDPAFLPLILPGQTLVFGPNTAATVAAMSVYWETIGGVDASVPAEFEPI